jgi:hypothetical protein
MMMLLLVREIYCRAGLEGSGRVWEGVVERI